MHRAPPAPFSDAVQRARRARRGGGPMSRTRASIALAVLSLCALPAMAQSFRVQCPTSTITHPDPSNSGVNSIDRPPYNGPTQFTRPTTGTAQWVVPTASTVNGGIKCQQISGGDGYATMADGTQTFMFSFGPLSGLAEIAAGHSGTQPPTGFNVPYQGGTAGEPNPCLVPGDPATSDGATSGASPGTPVFTWNGAVGLTPDIAITVAVSDLVAGTLTGSGGTAPHCPTPGPNTVTAYTFEPLGIPVNGQVTINQAPNQPGVTPPTPIVGTTPIPTQFLGTFAVTCLDSNVVSPSGSNQFAFQYTDAAAAGQGAQTALVGPTATSPPVLDGKVDPRPIIDVGVMNGNIPAPLAAFDEDDELFLTLTNVGMIMRPDLFEQHTIHFHGYPNASSFYDGVPDASVAINIGASFTYYYLAPDAGTYFWHCHITPPEHLQMGMVGQMYVRPRQDRVAVGGNLYAALQQQGMDLRTKCDSNTDILCSNPLPRVNTGATRASAGN